MGGSRGMLAAKHPLVVPMLLRLSHFKLSSYVVLVVSKQKGITLVFKTDPLQNVDINSTFDSIAVIQKFIQREIEGQLRQMFREDLPGIIHRLSQQWVKAKVEAPYLNKRPPPAPSTRRNFDTTSTSDVFPHRPVAASDIGIRPQLHRKTSQSSVGSRRPRPASVSGASVVGSGHPKSVSSPLSPTHEPSTSSHPDLENFDPTYGLRPEGLPTKSVFRGFSSLFTPNKGLADLTEELEDEESSEMGEYEDEYNSFDMVDWDDSGSSPPASVYHDRDRDTHSSTEYETIPAVGGGTITRPRIYHSQSAIQTVPLAKSLSSLPTRSYSQTTLNVSMGLYHPHRSGMVTPASNPYFPEYPPMSAGAGPSKLNPNASFNGAAAASVSGIPHHALPPSSAYHMGGFNAPGRPRTPDSFESQLSRSSSGPARTLSTDLTDHTSYEDSSALPSPTSNEAADSATATSHIYMRRPPSERRMSVTSNTTTTSTNNNNNHNNHDTSLLSTSPSNVHYYDQQHQGPAKIVLRPTLNNSIHQLSTLSHSNHTLSPYTRDLSHFTVRSVPPRGVGVGVGALGFGGATMGEKVPVKAKRKRMYRLGGKKPEPSRAEEGAPADADNINGVKDPRQMGDEHSHHTHFYHHHHHGASSPTPPSEFDVEDMDRYFPSSQDDLERHASVTGVSSASSSLQQPPLRQKYTSGYRTVRQRPTSLR
jgi:distribution and morphology protein 34